MIVCIDPAVRCMYANTSTGAASTTRQSGGSSVMSLHAQAHLRCLVCDTTSPETPVSFLARRCTE
jgi:hypothetical protein